MLHSGIDLHKRAVAIATVDPDGRPVRDVQLPAKREAVTRSFAGLPGGPCGPARRRRVDVHLVLAARPARRPGC
jgi:hypothetical protein